MRSAVGRRLPAVVAMAIGGALVVVGSLTSWVRTGGTRRHSYDLFALVERLGFAPDGAAAAALRWWPLVPLLAATGVVLAWWGWPRTGGVLGLVAAVYAGGVALAVGSAPAEVLDIEPGVPVTAVGGLILLAGSAASIVAGGWSTTPTDRGGPGRRAGPPADR